jgi:spore coat polysaccharide biosynthesis protein SpsF
MGNSISAIVQARMASSRLPGKVMKKINGKPLIYYLLTRLEQSKYIQDIVVATSTNKENDLLCDYIRDIGFLVVRGSEDDVLKRFVDASHVCSNDTLLRITGDTPLVDPDVVDLLIEYFNENNADYAYLSLNFAEGVDCEVITNDALLFSHNNAIKKSEREHVTLHIYGQSDRFKIVEMNNSQDHSEFRFTVDDEKDFQVVTSIINHFKDQYRTIRTADIIEFLAANPTIKKLNESTIRNEGLAKSLRLDEQSNRKNCLEIKK